MPTPKKVPMSKPGAPKPAPPKPITKAARSARNMTKAVAEAETEAAAASQDVRDADGSSANADRLLLEERLAAAEATIRRLEAELKERDGKLAELLRAKSLAVPEDDPLERAEEFDRTIKRWHGAVAPGTERIPPKPVPAPSSSPLAKLAAKVAARGGSATGGSGPKLPPHIIGLARAGTGKTWTVINSMNYMLGRPIPAEPSPQQLAIWEAVKEGYRPGMSVAMGAFGKDIAAELKRRVPPGVYASTMHGMGFGAIHKAFKLIEGEGKTVQGTRSAAILEELTGVDLRVLRNTKPVVVKAVSELVIHCKNGLVGIDWPGHPDGWDDEQWDKAHAEFRRLADHHEVELRDDNRNDFTEEVFDLVPYVLERAKDVARDGYIDHADMLWIPIVLNLPLRQYDIFFGDEVQDWNPAQQELACRAGRRLVLVGDDKQAIFGFAGADVDSIPNMRKRLEGTDRGCVVLPLTVTRRCGKAIVREAQRIVPEFEAHEGNGEGAVSAAKYTAMVKDGERIQRPWEETYLSRIKPDGRGGYSRYMVLCRVNAPLVGECYKLIKRKIPAKVLGRKIGDNLINYIRSFEASDVAELLRLVEEATREDIRKELARKFPNDNKIINWLDREECVQAMCEGVTSVKEVEARINEVFGDNAPEGAVRFASIHKSKGLESPVVFFLVPEGAGCPHPMAKRAWQQEQEMNLKYVGITRAIEELVWVS